MGFFARGHGKSQCDGIGGTLKRLTAKTNLPRHLMCQILTAKDMFFLQGEYFWNWDIFCPWRKWKCSVKSSFYDMNMP